MSKSIDFVILENGKAIMAGPMQLTEKRADIAIAVARRLEETVYGEVGCVQAPEKL